MSLRGSMFDVRNKRNIRIIYCGPLAGESRSELKRDEAPTPNFQRVGLGNVIENHRTHHEHTTEAPG